MQFSKNLEDNLEHLKQTLSLEKNFDVVYRVVSIGGKKFVVCGRTDEGRSPLKDFAGLVEY